MEEAGRRGVGRSRMFVTEENPTETQEAGGGESEQESGSDSVFLSDQKKKKKRLPVMWFLRYLQ